VSRPRFVLLLVVAALAAPAAATASPITIGPANPNPSPGTSQAVNWPNGTLLFTTSGLPGALLVSPAEGVITSWRLYTDDVMGEATAQLYSLTPTSGSTYVVSSLGPKQTVAPVNAEGPTQHNVLNTFPTRVPIAAGIMLGVRLEHEPGGYVIPVLAVAPGTTTGYLYSVPVNGGSAEAPNQSGVALAMNATLEPDVDHDGYGDESQDACVGVCQPPAPSKPSAKPKKCKRGKVRKHGKCVKKTHRKKHRR